MKAGMSQAAVSRLERGVARKVTLRTLDRIAEAVGARASVRLIWHGEDLDRLLDGAHAELVELVALVLPKCGWDVVTEATFSMYGERGSIDILAFRRGCSGTRRD